MHDISHFIIRNNLHIIHIHVEQLGHTDSKFHDISPEIPDLNDIPDLDISLHQKEDSREDITDQAVRSDTKNHRNDSGGCHQRSGIQSEAHHAAVEQISDRQISQQASEHFQDGASPDRQDIAHDLDQPGEAKQNHSSPAQDDNRRTQGKYVESVLPVSAQHVSDHASRFVTLPQDTVDRNQGCRDYRIVLQHPDRPILR